MSHHFPDLVSEGFKLDAAQVTLLQQQIQDNPKDIDARAKLSSCFIRGAVPVPDGLEHLLWLIDNVPEDKKWMQALGFAVLARDPSVCRVVRSHWLKQIERHPGNASVFGHAGLILIHSDLRLGTTLLTRAVEFEPLQYHWLGFALVPHSLEIEKSSLETAPDGTQEALQVSELFLRLFGNYDALRFSPDRTTALLLSSRCAFRLGDLPLAKTRAHQLMETNKELRHIRLRSGDSMLGIIAVREGDIATAKKHLLSIRKKHTVWIPDLELADLLISIGESKTVITYLQKCRKYGHWDILDIEQLVTQLQQGQPVSLVEARQQAMSRLK